MNKIRSIKVSFTGSNNNRLDGRLELPSTPPIAFIVFNHCFTCTRDILVAYRSSRILAKHGYAVLRFDFAGLGDSEGDFADCNFSTNVADTLAAIRFLDEHYRAPSLLIGHSLGGTAALAAAVEAGSIRQVVTIASPSQPAHVLHHFEHALIMLEQGIASSFRVAGKYYDINPQFIEDVRSWNMQKLLARLDKPVLIFHVEKDALVAENDHREIAQWVKGDTSIISLKETSHLLSDKQSNIFVINKIIEWLKKE